MSNTSRAAYPATEGQQEFDFPYPYLSRTHIHVTLNGVASGLTWVSDTRIRLPRACQAGDVVVILRDTPIQDPAVMFQNGSVLTEEELNTAISQLLYKAQEVEDLYKSSLSAGMVRLGDRLNVPSTGEDIIDEFVSMLLAENVLAEFRQRISDIDLNAEQIINQAIQITNAQATIDQQWSAQANAAAVVSNLQSNFDSLIGVVDGLVNIGDGEGIATLIANESNARIMGDEVLTSSIALLGSANGPRTAFTLNLNTVMANATSSMAQRLNAISAQADANSRTIFAEQITATSNAISAQGSTLTGLSTNVAGVRADLISESNLRSNAIAAVAGTLALLGANSVSGNSFILDQNRVAVSPTETIGQRLSTISANAVGLAAAINNEQTARIANGTSLATQITGVAARVEGANAAIQAEQTARSNGDIAEANARTALAATISNQLSAANAAIAAESTARATANSAQTAARQAAVSQLQTGLSAANAAIVGEATTRANAISAETSARNLQASTFQTGLNAANSAIQSEATTRSNADGALTSTLSLLGARNGPGTGFILNESTVQVNATTTLGTFLSGIDSRFGSASASVVNLTSALASANSVTASQISGLSAAIGGANASISQVSSIVSGPGGLTSQWGVVLNNNGHLSGIRLASNGATSNLTFVADETAFVAASGGTPIKIMSVASGKVVFNSNVAINGDLLVSGSINGGKLIDNAVTGIEAAYNNTTVVLAGTTPTRVHGLWLNVEKATSPIDIDFNCWGTFTHHAGGSFIAYVELVRASGTVAPQVLCKIPIYGSGMANDTWQGPVPVRFFDTPGATGLWHYYVQIYFNVSNMSTQSVTARYGKLTEMKNNVAALSTGTGSGPGSGTGGSGTGGGGDVGGGGGVTDPDPGGGTGGGGGIEQPTLPNQ